MRVAFLVAVFLIGCTTAPPVEPTTSPTVSAEAEAIVVGLPIPPFVAAPFFQVSNAVFIRASIHPELTSRLVYSTLYRYDDTLAPVPDLAAEPCAISDDGLTVTCQLVEATFHDGTRLTADDVAFTYEIGRRALTARGECIFAFGYCISDVLESATAIDERTVRFRLTRPDATFETLVMPDVLIHSRQHVEAAYASIAERAPTLAASEFEAASAAIRDQLGAEEPDCAAPTPRGEELLEAAGVELPPRDHFDRADGSFNECLYAESIEWLVADLGSSLQHTGLDAIARAYRALSLNRAPIGTGAFRFIEVTEGPRARLEAYPAYHHGPPAAPAVEILITRDSEAAQQKLLDGEIHWLPIRMVEAEMYEELSSQPGLRFAEYADAGFLMLAYNLREGMLLADVNLRTALELCIDKPATVDAATGGHGEPIYSFVPPISWAYHPDLSRPTRDVADARALIEASGWTEGEDGVYVNNGDRLATEVFVTAEDARRLAFMELIAEQARDCGMEITVVPADAETVLGSIDEYPHFPGNREEPFEAHFLGWGIGYDPHDAGLLLHSRGITSEEQPRAFNVMGYRNERVDELLDEGLATYDERERARIYREVQEIVAEDKPVLFAWAQHSYEAISERLGFADGEMNLNSPQWFWRLEKMALRDE